MKSAVVERHALCRNSQSTHQPTIETHFFFFGDETHFGGVEAHSWSVETHFGGVEAHSWSVETHFGGVEIHKTYDKTFLSVLRSIFLMC